MKTPLFDEFERMYIRNHYDGNIEYKRNSIISRYETAKALRDFTEALLEDTLFSKFIKKIISKFILKINNLCIFILSKIKQKKHELNNRRNIRN